MTACSALLVRVAFLLGFLGAVAQTVAAQGTAKSKDRSLPLKATRTIEFSTDEGSWMSLDVSPDGKTIVFDMLGDLYTMPIGGGTATALLRGIAFEHRPRYSPDGSQIAFVSNRDGGENVWLMDANGKNVQQLSRAEGSKIGSPMWTPSGDGVVALRSALNGPPPESWVINSRTGEHKKLQIAGSKSGEGWELLEAGVICRDGFVHYSELRAERGKPGYVPIMKTVRLAESAGEPVETIWRGVREIVSPDGRWVAYAAVQGPRSVLYQKDRATELRIRRHDHGASADTGQTLLFPMTTAFSGMFFGAGKVRVAVPGFAFTPDSKAILVTEGGKIKRVDVATRKVTDVPFTVNVKAELGPLLKPSMRLDDGLIRLGTLESVSVADDGKQLAFAAGGKVWLADSRGRARRLTKTAWDDGVQEYYPHVSPDGGSVVFSTWSDQRGGELLKASTADGALTRLASDNSGSFEAPRWTPDGRGVVYFAEDRTEYLANQRTRAKWSARLAWVSADGTQHRWLAAPAVSPTTASQVATSNQPAWISVSADGKRVYYVDPVPPGVMRSVPLDARDTSEVATHMRLPVSIGTERAIPSPDGKWLAVTGHSTGRIVLVPFLEFDAAKSGGAKKRDSIPQMPNARALIAERGKDHRIVLESDNGSPSWSSDGSQLTWTRGNRVYRLDVKAPDLAERARKAPGVQVLPTVPRAVADGGLLLRGARVVTVSGGVIERGDVLIRGRRIAAVGPSGSIRTEPATRVVDVAGTTIIPGLMDLHAHPHGVGLGISLYPNWTAPLAFGITTLRVPGHQTDWGSISELAETGVLVGPRLFHGGGSIGAYGVTPDGEGADGWVRAAKVMGANAQLKARGFMGPLSDQRIAIAAHAAGASVTGHWRYNMVFDGFSGWEHDTEVFPMYRDWLQLIARSGTTYTPTLWIMGGQLTGVTGSGRHDSVRTERQGHWSRPKDAKKQMTAREIYRIEEMSQGARDLLRAGGNVALGTDENYGVEGLLEGAPGRAVHAELLLFAAGGMTPAEVLRVATLNSARAIGVERDLGSIEVGKIADLVVLHSNPLEDLRNATDIRFVMKDGVLYAGESLDQVWPKSRPFRRPAWMKQ